MSRHRPPRWLESLVSWALPDGLSGEGALGDLEEEYDRRALRSGLGARLWYLWQAASIVAYRVLTGPVGGSTDSDLLADLRWTTRSMLRAPAFTAGVVGVLGLGLGANIAVFSVVDGTLANTGWWADRDRAVAVWPDDRFSLGQLEMYDEQQDVYEVVGGYVEVAFAVQLPDGESESVTGVVMTPTLFAELAVQPLLGRGYTAEDGYFGSEAVVVISSALWRRSFAADPGIIGTRIDVGGQPRTVVGVQGIGGAAPGGRTDLWLPIVPDPRDDDYWKATSFTVIGVLRPDADLTRAHDDLMAFTRTLSSTFPMFYPEGYAEGAANVARADEPQRRLVGTPLMLLLGGTILLMLVTALNVGSLLLGRALERRKELSVRLSLGASRSRIVSQLLVEGGLFTLLALALGATVGAFGGAWVSGLFVESAVVGRSPIFDQDVLLFAVAAASLAWVVVNGVPVLFFLRSAKTGLHATPASGNPVQRSLVTAQAALAMLLLVSASLLVTTVDNLRSVPLGFDPDRLLTVELSTPADRVESPAVARELYERLIEQVGAIQGVEAAGLTGWLPLREEAPPTPINLRAAPIDPREAVRAPMHSVDPGFFAALDLIPIEGRLLNADEADLAAPSAVVVNESLAQMLWPGMSPIGRMIAVDPHAWNSWVPVVGVVPDVRSGAIDGPVGPAVYVALAESPSRDVTLLVRGGMDAPELERAVRSAVATVDPLVPIRVVTKMEDVVRGAYSTAWVMMGLLTLLAGLATGLGALGIYAVLAQHVSLGRREIGVRMALGARPRNVIGSVVHSGLILVAIGIGIGGMIALWSNRFLESLLFGVTSGSALAFLAPVLALMVTAVVAAWIPAARAGRLPPAEVLNGD